MAYCSTAIKFMGAVVAVICIAIPAAFSSYTVSIGSFPPEKAEEIYKHLSASGYQVYMLYGESCEIRLGSYEKREEAETVREKLQEDEKIVSNVLEEESLDQSQFAWTDEDGVESKGKAADEYNAGNYSDPRARKIVTLGLDLFGHPYKYGGTRIGKGIDCSFFVQSIFRQLGIILPRTAREQIKAGKPVVKREELQVGDLVFFLRGYRTNKNGKRTYSKRINHVGIYIGNGEFIHATRNVMRVTISRLDEKYFDSHYAGSRRVLNDEMQITGFKQ